MDKYDWLKLAKRLALIGLVAGLAYGLYLGMYESTFHL